MLDTLCSFVNMKLLDYEQNSFYISVDFLHFLTVAFSIKGASILFHHAIVVTAVETMYSEKMYVYIYITSNKDIWELRSLLSIIRLCIQCMSGIGDCRFTFLIDLLINYTFYTNLTILSIGYLLMEDVTSLIMFSLWNVEKSMQVNVISAPMIRNLIHA